MKELVLVL